MFKFKKPLPQPSPLSDSSPTSSVLFSSLLLEAVESGDMLAHRPRSADSLGGTDGVLEQVNFPPVLCLEAWWSAASLDIQLDVYFTVPPQLAPDVHL